MYADSQKFHETKQSLITSIWNVFGILIEFANST
jgi:hypothetical protein